MMRLVHSSSARSDDNADEQALNWVVLLTSGRLTEEDVAAFRRWRDRSSGNREALAKAREAWRLTGEALPRLRRRDSFRQFCRSRLTLAIAASLALTIGLSYQYQHSWQYDYVSGVGERRPVTLADGSELMLGADTALKVDFSQGQRRITLGRGQIMLQVVHDDARPMIVSAGAANYRDVGTIFGVTRDNAASQMVVAEGLVEAQGRNRRVTLGQGWSASVDGQGFVRTRRVEPTQELAWAKGRMIFNDRPLRDIVGALRPYYRGRVFLLDATAANQRLSAVVQLDSIDLWLTGLSKTNLVKVNSIGKFHLIS
ncbi:hypothetical protein SPHS6_02999 [Sphingobium sp. S6]|nr:hypothetical protein SPHS8_02763 [Sphingobium sp. S8]CAD7340492.1 hypothetical protein SPHS6_02999 [Sphingobium sp. S6]